MTCATCNEKRVVMLSESVMIGRKRVSWVICARCWVAERKEHR